jgi:peptidylprolyl isomerase
VRRLLLLLLAGLLVLATAACGNDTGKAHAKASVDMGDDISGLKVTGKFGSEPTVEVDPAVKVDSPVTQVLSAGHGQPVMANKKAMLDITLVQGKDGKKLFSSAQQGTPTQVTMQENQFFKVLIDGLVGKPQGSRVAIAATVKDIWGSAGAPQLPLKPTDTVVWVVDVLSVEPTHVLSGPQGKKVTPPAHAPTVVESKGKVTGLDFSKAPKNPPKKLEVIPLVQGDGPAVKSGQLVTFNYYGAVWGRKKAFDSSYDAGTPATFGVGVHGLIPAWDKVIPGLKRGSRVLIVAPPEDAYGAQGQPGKIPPNSTLVFVVDVLGVGA